MAVKEIVKIIIGANNVFRYQEIKRRRNKPENASLLAGNMEFHNIHNGKRCFILGNGPSIRNVDFSLLADEYVFTVNQMPRMENFEKLKTNYHVWCDERFFDIHEDRQEDMELLEVMKAVSNGGNKPIVFYKSAAYSMVKKYKLDEVLNIKYFDDAPSKHPKVNMTFDFTKEVSYFPTVIQYVISLAVYIGFKEIYLLGCDCTGIVSIVQARIEMQADDNYAYEVSKNEKKRMQRTNSMNPIRDELYAYAELFDDYEWIRNYCLKHGVKLYNATNPTLLECVEKIDLKDVLRK